MDKTRSLTVLMPAVPGQRWSCHSCGDCCRALVGHLFEDERRRIDDQGWAAKLGVAPYVRIGREWALNKHGDGACVFLDGNNRCRIHAEFGEDSKPLACRIFPFSVRPTPDGWQTSLRFDCPSVIDSKGDALTRHRPWLTDLIRVLERQRRRRVDERMELRRGRPASRQEMDALSTRLLSWIKRGDVPLTDRLMAAVRATSTLHEARLDRVREERFAELLDLLFGSLPGDGARTPVDPTRRQCAMLRQLTFAHTEHVTLADLSAAALGRWQRRWRQLRSARRWRRGLGPVPPLAGIPGSATFELVESVTPSPDLVQATESLLFRYLVARIEGGTVWGGGYYGWPALSGLSALWLSLAASGWLARYLAAVAGRTEFQFADVGRAISLVDRAATRLPALGSVAERARVSYLLHDDGIARLVRRFRLFGSKA